MATQAQNAENRFMTLDRLLLGDRIVWQNADKYCPEAVWWEKSPQLGRPKLWLSTCKFLKQQGLIIEGLRPKGSHYRDMQSVTLFVATPEAEAAFIDFAAPVLA
jgi:hypothetical protein